MGVWQSIKISRRLLGPINLLTLLKKAFPREIISLEPLQWSYHHIQDSICLYHKQQVTAKKKAQNLKSDRWKVNSTRPLSRFTKTKFIRELWEDFHTALCCLHELRKHMRMLHVVEMSTAVVRMAVEILWRASRSASFEHATRAHWASRTG